MYRRPKFLETLIEIRCQMAEEAGLDVAAFLDAARTGKPAKPRPEKELPKATTSHKKISRNQPEPASRR